MPARACLATGPSSAPSAVGIYNFATGLLYLPASLVAGALWASSPSLVFLLAAAKSAVAIALFATLAGK